jgi:hypothetical protein
VDLGADEKVETGIDDTLVVSSSCAVLPPKTDHLVRFGSSGETTLQRLTLVKSIHRGCRNVISKMRGLLVGAPRLCISRNEPNFMVETELLDYATTICLSTVATVIFELQR